jgi:hypothetical protein
VTKRARIESPRSGVKARIEPRFSDFDGTASWLNPNDRRQAFVGDKSRISGRFAPNGYNPRHLATPGGTIKRVQYRGMHVSQTSFCCVFELIR